MILKLLLNVYCVYVCVCVLDVTSLGYGAVGFTAE